MSDDALRFAQQVLAAQPFSELLGARLTRFGEGVAVLEIDVEDRHRQQRGLVHGGVISYAADNVLTFAAGSVLGPAVVTGGLTVHYLAPVRHGVLRAVGTVVHQTRRQVVGAVQIEEVAPDGSVTLCAAGSGTVVATRADDDGTSDAVPWDAAVGDG